jgi:hypothetical protein
MNEIAPRGRSLSVVFIIAGFVSAIVLIVNALKRAEILPLSPATQLAAPVAQLAAIGLIVGLFVLTPALRGRLASIGVVLYVASLVALVGVEFVINLVFPYVAPEIVGHLRTGPLGIAFTVASISFLLGTLTFYIALWRVAQSPKVAIVISVISSVPIALRTAFPEVALQLGLVGLAIGVSLLALWLLRTRSTVPSALASRASAIA